MQLPRVRTIFDPAAPALLKPAGVWKALAAELRLGWENEQMLNMFMYRTASLVHEFLYFYVATEYGLAAAPLRRRVNPPADVNLSYVEMVLMQVLFSWVAGARYCTVSAASSVPGLLSLTVAPGFLRVSMDEVRHALSAANLGAKLAGSLLIVLAILNLNGRI